MGNAFRQVNVDLPGFLRPSTDIDSITLSLTRRDGWLRHINVRPPKRFLFSKHNGQVDFVSLIIVIIIMIGIQQYLLHLGNWKPRVEAIRESMPLSKSRTCI